MKTKNVVFSGMFAIIFATSTLWATDSKLSPTIEPNCKAREKETELTHSNMAKHTLEVPYNLVHDYFLIVKVTINGENLDFLFDESSLFTVLNKEKAELLGVNEATRVYIGNQPFGRNIQVSDFTHLKASGLNVDGIIGSAIVDYYDIIYDFDHTRLIITNY